MNALEACRTLVEELRRESNDYAGILERALDAYDGDVEKACIYVETRICREEMEEWELRCEDGNRAHGCHSDATKKEERDRSMARTRIGRLRRTYYPESSLPMAAFDLRYYWSYTLPKKK